MRVYEAWHNEAPPQVDESRVLPTFGDFAFAHIDKAPFINHKPSGVHVVGHSGEHRPPKV